MENNNAPLGIVVIDLVNDDDNENLQQANANINHVLNDQHRQRQIEEAADTKEDRIYETERLRAVQISTQMTEALVSNYVPRITQINCVVNGMTIAAAFTKGGDNNTPCDTCGNHGDPESCFWTMAKIELNIKG